MSEDARSSIGQSSMWKFSVLGEDLKAMHKYQIKENSPQSKFEAFRPQTRLLPVKKVR
jgi:hypothetical protein